MNWLTAQGNALLANLSDLAANKPEPAREVIIYTAATAALGWLIFMIVKAVK